MENDGRHSVSSQNTASMPSDYPAVPPPPSSRIAAKPTSADCLRRLWHPNNRPPVYSWAFVPQRGCNIAKAAWRQPCRRFPLSPEAGRFAAAGDGRCCRWTRGHRDRSVLRPILVVGGERGRYPAVSVYIPTRRHRVNGKRPGVLRHRSTILHWSARYRMPFADVLGKRVGYRAWRNFPGRR